MSTETNCAFNLLDEPWIPVYLSDGTIREVSLSDALTNPTSYKGIAENSPCNLIAIYRLLLAILNRALSTSNGRWSEADRAVWFRKGVPVSFIVDYLEQWRERFWLFHPSHPFMQVAALETAKETKDSYKPWVQIALQSATGNTPTVFDHSVDALPKAATPALACRHLLGFLQFVPGGLVKVFRGSDNAGPLANTAAVLPLGINLAETLLLSLHPFKADDIPSWEQAPPTVAQLQAKAKLVSGPNDRYTRTTRAVQLIMENSTGLVHKIRFAVGLAIEEDPNSRDTMACYRIDKKGFEIRISFNEGRSFWRDLPSLVPDSSKKRDKPASVMEWATNLHETLGNLDSYIQILSAGLSSDQAKLLRWRNQTFAMPLKMLSNPSLADEFRNQVKTGEDIFFQLLRICTDMITLTFPDPLHKDSKARAKAVFVNGPAVTTYFSKLESEVPLLLRLIAEEDIEAAEHTWKQTISNAVLKAYDITLASLGSSPSALRAQARTYPKLMHLRKKLAQPDQENNTKEIVHE